ncbi:uncharacterized protein LOC143298886 [Babylonia areolata]|uniref:uncharacterized protein LOC143298886 n=1 Tax=Babylonia areolata TaxID=304850 RepID=UPI003FD13FB0
MMEETANRPTASSAVSEKDARKAGLLEVDDDSHNIVNMVTSPAEEEPTRKTASQVNNNDDDGDGGGGDDDDTDGVPYDRGWAWMVLLGSVVNYGLISLYLKTMGVFFVELLQHFQAPASRTALLFAVRAGVTSVAGMFIMNAVIGRLGCRKTALIGGVLLSLSAILSSQANSLVLLICLQAVLLGFSESMLAATAEVLTATYFRRRRSLAMAVVKSSASVASMSYPPLLALLLERYGLRGALLLTGGLSLHALPAALLLRPASFYRRRQRPRAVVSLRGEGQHLLSLGSSSSSSSFPRNRSCVGVNKTQQTVPLRDESEHLLQRSSPSFPRNRSCVGVNKTQQTVPHDEGEDLLQRSPNSQRRLKDRSCASLTKPPHSASQGCDEEWQRSSSERCLKERPCGVSSSQTQQRFDETVRETDAVERNAAQYCVDSKDRSSVSLSKTLQYPEKAPNDGPQNFACKESALKRALMSEMEARFKLTAGPEEEDVHVSVEDSCSKGNIPSFGPAYKPSESIQRKCKDLPGHNDSEMQSVNAANTKPGVDTTDEEIDSSRTKRPPQRLKSALRILDFSLFRQSSFVLVFFYLMLSPNINVGLDYFPALAQQQGLSKAQTAQLLSVVGATDLVARLSTGVVANLGLVPVPVLPGVALTALGTVYQCTRWMTSFWSLVALAVAQGVLAGVVNGVVSMLILHVVGLPRLAPAIGFHFLAEGAFSSGFHPLLGYIRDKTGSYVVVYHVTGCCLLAAAIILLIEEVVRKREERNKLIIDARI